MASPTGCIDASELAGTWFGPPNPTLEEAASRGVLHSLDAIEHLAGAVETDLDALRPITAIQGYGISVITGFEGIYDTIPTARTLVAALPRGTFDANTLAGKATKGHHQLVDHGLRGPW